MSQGTLELYQGVSSIGKENIKLFHSKVDFAYKLPYLCLYDSNQ